MQSPSPATLALLIAVPLILWRVYARIRRKVGRQKLSKVRPWLTVVFFPLIVALLALATLSHPERLAWLVAGLAGGAMLGVHGLRKTRFEPTPQGLFYTPNAHLGIALSLLLVGRIAYRFVEIYVMNPGAVHTSRDFARSPLTLAVFGLLAGYYIAYAIGLIRWRRSALAATPA
jgi:hypothetical protein